ncbi:MAG: matrixin family metalloprotease [Candidatus Daviesbacteria bacterium]|nr:matrixin family metalloprotease [Candidatus Daviesbacteria bacterium]
MKNMIALVIFILVSVSSAVVVSGVNISSPDKFLTYSFCDEPIRYRIDTVDAKFDKSRNEFLADISEAAEIWNGSINKTLFTYDPKGDLSINLIYDERQSLTTQIDQLENKVQSEKNSLNPQISEFKKLSADFKKKVADLNQEIDSWNSQGGAPPEEYEKLVKKEQDLQAEADNLSAMAQKLNVSTETYNAEVNELNQTIGTFQDALAERPEEGIYKGKENRIEVYFNVNKPELIHTLAHELGHAIGITGHVSNPEALMYAKTSQKLIPTKEDILALEDVCKRFSILELAQMRLTQAASYYRQLFSL